MKMIKAVVRPEKCDQVLNELCGAGYRAVTRFGILGRGKQRGLKVEDVYYDEIPKEMLMLVVEDGDVKKVTDIIIKFSIKAMPCSLRSLESSFMPSSITQSFPTRVPSTSLTTSRIFERLCSILLSLSSYILLQLY